MLVESCIKVFERDNTLANCSTNGVDVHLFEVMDEGRYTFCGRIEQVGNPYTETQLGEDGINRLVWMFPIRPIPENDVKKPSMFTFMDMEDYITRGKNVDVKYNAGHKVKAVKKSPRKSAQKVRHKKFGERLWLRRRASLSL